jgi:hypothetical protein
LEDRSAETSTQTSIDGLGAEAVTSGGLTMALALGLAGLGFTACSDTSTPEPTVADYTSQLEAICAATAAQLDALPDPADGTAVAEFATQASAILTAESEQIRELVVPDDLDDDHRALIGNDEEQAAAWTQLAAAPAADATTLSELTTAIASLNLGRNDLVTEMGAPACARLPG